MNNYESYKETDIPWLGEIPSHWEINRVKRFFYIFKDISYKKNPVVLSLARDKVKIRDIESNKGQLAENYNNYNSVKKGDLLLNPMDLYSGANCNISNYDGVISPAYINLRSNKDISVNFFDYIFKLQYTSLAFQSVGKGVSKYNRWTLSNETLLNYQLPIPPISEQIKIANYLDWKINEIDRLILIEKEQIKELNHHKKLLISYEYSKQNKKRRIKTLLAEQLLYGINETGKENGNIRFVRITDIDTLGNLKNENILYLNKCDKKFLLIEDDILFARSGATVGKTYLQKKETSDMAFAGYLIRARINKNLINPKYVYYYFQSQEYEIWKESIFIQSTIQNISAERFANLEIPFADKLEQNIIIKRVKNIIAKTEKILNLLNEKISNLSLISLKKRKIISSINKIQLKNHNQAHALTLSQN